jgi:hypothetical protein
MVEAANPCSGCVFLWRESDFRDAERLHRAGLVTAVASKSNWIGIGGGKRAFRELAVFATESEARARYGESFGKEWRTDPLVVICWAAKRARAAERRRKAKP